MTAFRIQPFVTFPGCLISFGCFMHTFQTASANKLCIAQAPAEDTKPMFLTFVCLFLTQQPPLGQSFLIHEVSRSHTRRTTVGRTPLDE
jgi:hypothetical protein